MHCSRSWEAGAKHGDGGWRVNLRQESVTHGAVRIHPGATHGIQRFFPEIGGVYGMAFIGAAIYFIGHATSFWMGVLGFFKALFWPALIMYKVLELLAL
jgi:hypothetical protein